MPDLTEQLSSLLSDPAGMEKIKAMAESLFAEEKKEEQSCDNIGEQLLDIQSLGRLAGLLKQPADDNRIKLLYALKPHLSTEKQQRVDKAVKMLRLMQLAPLLSQAGIFEF